ncbi:uncharacterized protein LOC129729131 [Wyeomyia smithii]|uniref:uncharacterized protein LOC129729131 n=1 Tax=Wyeomyia smithii TaxID=174621 RepID=UPI002467BE73|nr:uncharacterized protein LOC129729131 [Wyeomyia smithii]
MDPSQIRRDLLFQRVKWEHSNASTVISRNPLPSELQERLQKLSELYDNFDRVQSEIEETTPGVCETASIFNHRLEFDRLYYATKEEYTRLLDQHLSQDGNESIHSESRNDDIKEAVRLLLESQRLMMSTQSAAASSVSQLACQINPVNHSRVVAETAPVEPQIPLDIRLPTLSLPVFYGDRKQWNSFKDLYVSCIHEKRLKESVKLQYLLSHLDGDAKKLVSAFAITDANYIHVWQKLNEFYDKKKYTVAAIVKEFIEQSPVTVPSLVALRKLVTTSDEVIRQLKALGEEHESRDPWLIHLLLDKLDRETRVQWAQKLVDIENPKFTDFLTFLERRCDALETCASFIKKGSDTVKKEGDRRSDTKSALSGKPIQSFHTSTQLSCPNCSQAHTIYQCASFKEMAASGRREIVQKAKLCFNCLRATHVSRNCTSTTNCKMCHQKHHTLLCQTETTSPVVAIQYADASEDSNGEAAVVHSQEEAKVESYVTKSETSCSKKFVSLLPTAIVKVKSKGKNNVFHEVRALVDSACMSSLITKQAFQRLGLNRRNASILVSGINSEKPCRTEGAVVLQISSRFNELIVIVVEALILNQLIPDQPCQEFDIECNSLREESLADPTFNQTGQVDLLLGVEVFFSILEPGKLMDSRGYPIAQNSIFGYLIGGRFGAVSNIAAKQRLVSLVTEINLDRTLRQFWELEDLPKTKPLSENECKAVEHFRKTCTRNESGRYVVRLPFDAVKPALGDSANSAIRRFKAMERKFSIDEELRKQYTNFMTEYLQLGHMERIPPSELVVDVDKCFYLPHHAVLKDDSKTTRLRVVFDASNKTTTGISLNDRLLIGPNVNEPLFNVFSRWRTYRIAFTADVEKMYRQVLLNREDIDFQRIVWREHPNKPLEYYRLLTVTYGTASAAYLAVAALRKVAEDNKLRHPLASDRIAKNFYVDDLLSGADTLAEAKFLQNEITEVLASGGFILRKWFSNEPKLLNNELSCHVPIALKLPNEEDAVKALGIQWIPQEDTICFKIRPNFLIHLVGSRQ